MNPFERKRISLDPRKVYFGWWMTIAGGLLCFLGYSYSAYGFAALFKPISADLGLSRASTSVAASITRFEGGLEAPVVGYMADRYGPKITVFIGIFVAGLGLVLMYYVNSVWSFYLVWGVILATGINVALSMPLDVALANWFVKKRGTAISIKWVFSGLSGTLGLPILAWLISGYGWRWTCVIGGLALWVIGLPLVWFFIRTHRPEYYGQLPDGAAMTEEESKDVVSAGAAYAAAIGEQEFTTKEAMKTAPFWLLILAYSIHGALYPVMNIHCIAFLTDRGMDMVVAAATMSVFITASIPARFVGGVIVDRVSTKNLRYAIASCFALQALGVTLFLFNQQSSFVLYTFFIMYGIGMGAPMPMTPVMRARYFGRKHFGAIAGISRMLSVPVGVVGPVLAGWIYDATGSYEIAFMLFAITMSIAVVLMCFVKPPKPPQREPVF